MTSTKPIFWALFAAGGTLAAFAAPVLILITGPALPLGLLNSESLNFDRLTNAMATMPVAIAMAVFIVLTLWHAAHRLRVTAHDLGWFQDRVAAALFYGLAAVGSLVAVLLLV